MKVKLTGTVGKERFPKLLTGMCGRDCMEGREVRLGRVISTIVESSFRDIVDSTTSSFTT